MWNRKDLKEKAKRAFNANYWRCLLVNVIMTLLVGSGAGSVASTYKSKLSDATSDLGTESAVSRFSDIFNQNAEMIIAFLAIILGIISIALVLATLIDLFVTNPVLVGTYSFFSKNTEEKAKLDTIFGGFKNGYLRNVGAMFLKDLFIVLGCIVLVVPGIILTYGFKMVPYILAEHPEMTAMESLKESLRIMKGNKWRAFVIDLSFIGWDILACLTFGILATFYVGPYKRATDAELYKAIR